MAKTRALWEKMGKTQSSEEMIKRKRGATRKESGVGERFSQAKITLVLQYIVSPDFY